MVSFEYLEDELIITAINLPCTPKFSVRFGKILKLRLRNELWDPWSY